MRKPVTTDTGVLQGWPKSKKAVPSAAVAASLGITVFQITARLKGMEGRGFVSRNPEGLWSRTQQGESEAKNPSPSVSGTAKKMRQMDSNGNNSGPPDDSKLPVLKIKRGEWCPPDKALKHAEASLPVVQGRLASMQKDPKRYRREIMAMQVEIDNCTAIIKRNRKGAWTSRYVHDKVPFSVFIAPDQREYVHARPWETADILIAGSVNSDPIRLRLYSTSNLSKNQLKIAKEKDARLKAKREQAQDDRNKRIIAADAIAKNFVPTSMTHHAKENGKAEPAAKGQAKPAKGRQEASRNGHKEAGAKGKRELPAVHGSPTRTAPRLKEQAGRNGKKGHPAQIRPARKKAGLHGSGTQERKSVSGRKKEAGIGADRGRAGRHRAKGRR